MLVFRILLLLALSLAGALIVAACAPREDYAAELGFYQDGRLRWDISGSYPTFEDCKAAAMARHEIYTRQDREYSWACLLRDPETGGYAHRYR
jgi:hypothetical protein